MDKDKLTLDAFLAQLGESSKTGQVEILPLIESAAKRLKADFGMGVDDAEYVLKDNIPDIPDIPENDFKNADRERTIDSYINTITKDRDAEVVLPEGAMLDDYKRLPIVLFGHRYDELGVGINDWIVSTHTHNKERNYGLIARTRYASIKANPFADQVYNWRLEGMPMGESIGFVPVEFVTPDDSAWDKLHDGWVKRVTAFLKGKGEELTADIFEGVKRIFTKWLLLEYSDVMVPSNPYAVTLAVEKGLISNDDIEWYTIKTPDSDDVKILDTALNATQIADLFESTAKIETTATFHRIPVNECEITATIDIDADAGIKALYCGEEKQVGTYLFDVNKWSMDDAKVWVKEHKDDKAGVGFYEKAFEHVFFDEESLRAAAEVKEGRIISAKNRVILQNTYDATGNAREALGELLKATDPDPDDIDLDAIDDVGVKFVNTDFTRWNKSLSKAFDLPLKEETSTTYIHGVMKNFLGCDTKDIFINEQYIPSPLLPTYLAGFKSILDGYSSIDTRNFGRDIEVPPIYETIKLNSTDSDDFLIDGMDFYKADGKPLIVEFSPGWSGISISLITTTEDSSWNKDILGKVQQWVKDNNFLKGEKFALSGEFLDESEDEWSDIVLNNDIVSPIKKSISSLNTKGATMSSRGLMFVGPPGTGKTKTGRVMMKTPNTTFIWVSSEDFARMDADRVISLAFSLARDLAPTILFIEDIDTWLRTYMVDLLKTTMDGLKQNKGIITVLTSNDPERLPDALLDRPGRFHHILEFSLPSSKLRSEMITKWVGDIEDDLLNDLLAKTEGFSGAHIEELVTWAKMLAEDDDIPLATALMRSLNRLLSQRELIARIREGKKGVKYIDLTDLVEKDSGDIDAKPVGDIDWAKVALVDNTEDTDSDNIDLKAIENAVAISVAANADIMREKTAELRALIATKPDTLSLTDLLSIERGRVISTG